MALASAFALGATLAMGLGAALAAPVIEITPPALVFPRVTLGDTSTTRMNVTNRGDATLSVTGIDLPPGVTVSSPPAFDLAPDSTILISLQFAPSDDRADPMSLTVHSNDPVTPDATVSWTPDVLALRVDASAFTTSPQYPLGEALVIQCVPADGVHVEVVTLFYRSGEFANFLPLAMVPNGHVFIGIIPGGFVQEGGVEFYVVAENAPFTVTNPEGGAGRPFRVDVEPPRDFKLDPVVRHPGLGFKAGENIDFLLTLARGTVFDRGVLHYRAVGDSVYHETSILEISFTGINASIPGPFVGPRGIEYWAEIHTLTTRLTQPFDPAVPIALRITNDHVAEPKTHAGGHYRMLSIPMDLPGAHLGTILSDEAAFGTYDPVRWRAFRFAAQTQSNIELSPADVDTFLLRPGRAFWLVSRDEHRVDTAPATGVSTPGLVEWPLVLSPGWNQIGNPFAFPVALTRIRRSFPVSAPIAYDSAIDDYSDEDVTELEPFMGYFIDNPSSVPETLYIPPIAVDSAQTVRPVPGLLASLRLEARSPHGTDLANRIGIVADAGEELDAWDRPKPPVPPGSAVRLSLANRGWRDRPGLYRRDVRSAHGEGATWEIEVTSRAAGEPVELTLHREGSWPPGTAMRLLDREQGSVVDLDPTAAVWRHEVLAFGARPYRLALLAGSRDYVRGLGLEERPDRLVLDAVSPNPTRGPQRLRFGLPRAASVRLEVFDASGRRVSTLLDGAELPAGYHTTLWRPERSGSGGAASGIYFHRLTVDGETRTARAVVVR